ncbi:PadR family transcriptional regulator [Natrinema ejinorense]|uniref:PadR family transcriptional regulator n=1 Tax=Natrinema ejinorense TaxID=373386 RepID=A0A2A5QP83_9EURY|nr:PadR family transcriptional regulator [Natrinema ejinorense]PCR88656.1 PadR family transcriptional regulator [Natrinema ejinorense]
MALAKRQTETTTDENPKYPEYPHFRRDLLFVIADVGPASGQDVQAEIEAYYAKEINHGRLYPNLDALVDDGLVEKGEIDDRTNSYELTDAGRQALEERREWEAERLPEGDA